MKRKEVIKDPKKLELTDRVARVPDSTQAHQGWSTALPALLKVSLFSHLLLLSPTPTDVRSGMEGSWAQRLLTCWSQSLLQSCPDHVQK